MNKDEVLEELSTFMEYLVDTYSVEEIDQDTIDKHITILAKLICNEDDEYADNENDLIEYRDDIDDLFGE